MLLFQTALLAALASLAYAQHQQATTPVPILKQINKQNEDGSYSFGYEAADGSFKIETKYPNGDVAGKYGYVDETGNLREISYGASSKRGFEPQGEGIVVPPPALNEPTTNELKPGDEDDGQYREDPHIYEDPKYNRNNPGQLSSPPSGRLAFRQFHKAVQPQQEEYDHSPAPAPVLSSFRSPRPLTQVYHQQPTFNYNAYTPQPHQQPQYQQPQYQPQYQQTQYQQPQYQPQYQQLQYQQPQYQQPQYQAQYQKPQYSPYQQQTNYNPFLGHPAQNFDPNTGSYSITYAG